MEAPTKTFYVIAVHRGHPDFHESTPIVWCGHDGFGHVWKKGDAGLNEGIRFLRSEDAFHAGVSGPNYHRVALDAPEGETLVEVDCNRLPDRGIMVMHCTHDGVFGATEGAHNEGKNS